MPYGIVKQKNGCYTVYNKDTGAIKAKCTDKMDAMRQIRLLYGLEHGWKPSR